MAVRIAETRHIADLKPGIVETAALRLVPGDRQQAFREIDPDDAALRPDPFGGGEGGSAGAATDIEDAHARHQPEPLDRAPPGALPETERRVVEMVGGD